MRCACIDIGSNTTRLLVAEADATTPGGLREVLADRAFVPLTAHERAEGLEPATVRALEAAVAAHAASARAAGALRLRVVATAALRRSAGRDGLLERLADAAGGTPVEVLTGEEEARLAFAGATAALPPGGQTVVVVDVGGGSTELAAGTPGAPATWWASVPVGSSMLTDAHLRSDPPSAAQLQAARDAAAAALAGVRCPGASAAWAVGGSATSLRRLVGDELSREALRRGLATLCGVPAPEAAALLDLDPRRARLLPAALVLLEAVGATVGCVLRVAGGGLREGVVLDLLRPVQ